MPRRYARPDERERRLYTEEVVGTREHVPAVVIEAPWAWILKDFGQGARIYDRIRKDSLKRFIDTEFSMPARTLRDRTHLLLAWLL